MIHQSRNRLAVLIFLCLAGGPALAQLQRTIVVDPIMDSAPDAGCTLREAISVANAGLGDALGCVSTELGSGFPLSYSIEVPALVYTLSGGIDDGNAGGDLDLLGEIRISGAGPEATVIDGNGIDRVLHLVTGRVELEDLRLTGGASKGCGGGIYGSDMVLRNVWVDNNQSSSPPGLGGGGICADSGSIEVLDGSRVFANSTNNRGGGIMVSGDLVIADARVEDNNSGGLGGGISTIGGRVTIYDSIISGNQADRGGGGLFLNASTQAAIANSIVVHNRATSGAGIARPRDGLETVSIANTIIAFNVAVSATGQSSGGGIGGGGMVLTHVTVTGNIADVGAGIGGGFVFPDTSFRLANSIVAGNLDSEGVPSDCFGVLTSERYNIIGGNRDCEFGFPAGDLNVNNDLVGTAENPLDPLFRRGALEPAAGSPAADAVPAEHCVFLSTPANPLFASGDPVLTDQRGLPRGRPCDIGAFESTQLFVNGFEAPSL
ncbi:MAG: right-handed parallel beta-helix repeat-containing protein [Pseudomonadota bacterium]